MKRIYEWGILVAKSFLDSHCSLHAAGLTYYSMLALIPILCCIVFLAKVASVDKFARDQINSKIDAIIVHFERGGTASTTDRQKIATEEFAVQARKFSDQLFKRIDRFNVSRLGLIGVCMLLWTVVSTLGQVEISIDEVWKIEKPRPIWKKAYLYLFVSLVMPVFAVLAMSLPVLNIVKQVIVSTMGATWLTKWASDGLVWFIDWRLFRLVITFSFASLAFGYFLWVMPNRRVKLQHALYGGVMTAALFSVVMKVCASAQVGLAKSSALYGSFAFLPIVLAWFYMSWQVILLGASMTRAFDVMSGQVHPHVLANKEEKGSNK